MENLDQDPVIPRLDLVVLDCPDALELGTFYAKLLTWRIEEGSDRDWTTLTPPRGGITPENLEGEATLAFQRIDDYVAPTWPTGTHPQQFHLDFSVSDVEEAEPRVLSLGATVHEQQPSASGSFKVYLDPAGHPFCLVRHSVV
ncbi:VOC family protein [Brachybacterium rhamnosum]|uniref:VOC family protein n=1 Tax=Brachybacterium rhamnosum TaxID=173361 RepID=A0ABW4PVD6_9MICO